MTFRLVALMCVVLLLSLAAFALLMNHYQDEVLQEVARTASAVGRATLRTLDNRIAPGGAAGPERIREGRGLLSWSSAPQPAMPPPAEFHHENADRSRIERIEHVVSTSSQS